MPVLKKILHWTGGSLSIIGLIFVAIRIQSFGIQIDFGRFGLVQWSAILSFSLIYGIANLMLALAWWNLLNHFGKIASRKWSIRTYGISQLAKYVPGNIFHLAGRQAIGMAAGIPARILARSMAWEIGVISFAGGVLALFSLPRLIFNVPTIDSLPFLIMLLFSIFIILRRYFSNSVIYAFGWHIAFLAASGLLFVGLYIVSSTNTMDGSLWISLGSAYIAAWLVGLLTPGAPAGIGIRELVLLFLVNGLVNEADLLIAVVTGRVVTVTGDVLFFAATSLSLFHD